MNKKHIIWDWNGTLLNDAWLSVYTLNHLLDKYSLPPITLEIYQNTFSFPVIDFYKEIGFDFDDVAFEEVGRLFIEKYNAHRSECSLHEGALDMLKKLKDKGLTQSVLSASYKDYLLEIVKHNKIEGFFSIIDGIDDIYASSKVDLGKKHIKKLGIAKEEILLIGDTTHDFEVAEALGVDCVFISMGHFAKERLKNFKVFDSYEDIFDNMF